MTTPAQAAGTVPTTTVTRWTTTNWGGDFATSTLACQYISDTFYKTLSRGAASYLGSYNCFINANTTAFYVVVPGMTITACPANSTSTTTTACTCDSGYSPDPSGTACVAPASACPVTGLDEITDPVALLYENGTYNDRHPDLLHLNAATQAGLACIQQKVAALNCYMTPRPTSGYRPAAYQKHIYDVYTKWQKLENDNTPGCASIKKTIYAAWLRHKPFVHQPGATSNHSQLDAQGKPSGNAVDISPVPDNALDHADAIACQCNMYRRLKKDDPVHYEPRVCPH